MGAFYKEKQAQNGFDKLLEKALGETKTLRDEFAMAALPSCIISVCEGAKRGIDPLTKQQIAESAYIYADEMLKARNSKQD